LAEAGSSAHLFIEEFQGCTAIAINDMEGIKTDIYFVGRILDPVLG